MEIVDSKLRFYFKSVGWGGRRIPLSGASVDDGIELDFSNTYYLMGCSTLKGSGVKNVEIKR